MRCLMMFRLILAGLLAWFSLSLTSAQAQSRGVFVSPTTGVGVGSIWGVFIGVSQYSQKDLNLKYADKDAQALHSFFVNQFKGRISADQFHLITNSQATRGRVLKEVSEVLRLAQPEDLVILSLALHGLPDASGQDLYFLAYDADANLPEDRGISRDDLLKQISRSKARKIVLLVDACHAGAFGASPMLLAMRSANAADINRMLVAMGQAQDGIAVLSASSAAERSQEGPQFCGGHGAFTCALLEGLKGAADADENGLVQMRELYDHTYREVKRLTTGYQNPEIQGRYDNGLPLAATGKVATVPAIGVPSPTAPGQSAALRKAEQDLKALEEQEQQVEDQKKLAAIQRKIEEKKRKIQEAKEEADRRQAINEKISAPRESKEPGAETYVRPEPIIEARLRPEPVVEMPYRPQDIPAVASLSSSSAGKFSPEANQWQRFSLDDLEREWRRVKQYAEGQTDPAWRLAALQQFKGKFSNNNPYLDEADRLIRTVEKEKMAMGKRAPQMPTPSQDNFMRPMENLKSACGEGQGQACQELGWRYELSGEDAQAATYYRQGCTETDPLGCLSLGRLANNGQTSGEDFSRATDTLQRVCEAGGKSACTMAKTLAAERHASR